MGRRPHPPGYQDAMGNPGRRKSKPPAAKRKIEFGSVAPPPWLKGRDFAGALDAWRRIAPQLARVNVLTPSDADAFARYCVHLADWVRLTKVIRKEGETQSVTTVSGDLMVRLRPEFKARELAERRVLELEDRFGLSPRYRLDLYRDMNALNVPVGDLFSRPGEPEPDQAAEQTDGPDDIIGFGRRDRPGPPLPN